jgi:hypothetical protein
MIRPVDAAPVHHGRLQESADCKFYIAGFTRDARRRQLARRTPYGNAICFKKPRLHHG